MAKEDKLKNCWCEVQYFLPKTSCQIRCTRPEKHLCQIICPTAVKEQTHIQINKTCWVIGSAFLVMTQDPKLEKNAFDSKFLVTNKLQLYAPSSTTNLALLLCMMYEVTTQHSAPTLERRNSDHMQNMCQNVEAFKVNRLVYATFLSFFFSQHRIRTRQYELLLNLTHYTFVSKTSVLSYSKPDIHR